MNRQRGSSVDPLQSARMGPPEPENPDWARDTRSAATESGRGRIVLLEIDVPVRRDVKRALSKRFDLDVCADVQAALAAAAQSPIDVIVVEISKHQSQGSDQVRELRSDGRTATIPII